MAAVTVNPLAPGLGNEPQNTPEVRHRSPSLGDLG